MELKRIDGMDLCISCESNYIYEKMIRDSKAAI